MFNFLNCGVIFGSVACFGTVVCRFTQNCVLCFSIYLAVCLCSDCLLKKTPKQGSKRQVKNYYAGVKELVTESLFPSEKWL